jgi:hypothetical protein
MSLICAGKNLVSPDVSTIIGTWSSVKSVL